MRLARGIRTLVCSAMLLSVLFAAAPAMAKSYTIDEVAVEADLSSAGDLTIIEQRALTFDGAFSRVFWTIDKERTDGIEILGVLDDRGAEFQRTDDPASLDTRPENFYYVEDNGESVVVHAYHQSSNESRSFMISYKALGAADRWADTGELYWQLLGDESDIATARFSATVAVEGATSKDQMQAWAHGPLTGVVDIAQDGKVTLTADDVPPNTFVEVRLAFPAELLSGMEESSQEMQPTILAEEQGLAEEANARRRSAKRSGVLWTTLPTVLALGALGYGIVAFVRYGREYGAEFKGRYFREDPKPELHPAVVGALWRFGTVEDTDIAATLMDLADKGVIRMAPVTEDKPGLAGVFGGTVQTFMLERTDTGKTVSALDAELIALLFDKVAGGRQTLSLSEIEPYAKANAETFSKAVTDWKASAEAEADKLGLFETESWAWQVGVFALAFIAAGPAIFGAIETENGWPLLVALPAAGALAVIGVFMRRRSRGGNELFRQYAALRLYLKDFSRLEEAPPSSVVLWNRFLVLAVVFGVAEQVIEQLRVRVPGVVADPSFQTSYWWVYSAGHGMSPISAVSSSLDSAASVARSTMSSSSGGGGGFSGGGGGGGGGGGFGAD